MVTATAAKPDEGGAAPPEEQAADDETAAPEAAAQRRWRPHRLTVAVLLVGLAVTAALTVTAAAVYRRNENRLLDLRAKQVGSVVSAAVPSVQTPLAAAAALADATSASAKRFAALLGPSVGPGRQFVSASLWPVGAASPHPVAVLGVPPALAANPAYAASFLAAAARSPLLNVTHVLTAPELRLGYALSMPAARNGFVVYTESALPKNRRSRLQSNSAFSDLNYVIYLGAQKRPSNLLLTSLNHFPIQGRQATTRVPFGTTQLTLVVTPRGSLGGGFFHSLPWIIAVLGTLLSLAAAAMTGRLVRRRAQAEGLAQRLDRIAEENRRLYAEQRGIAQTLQHALLPESLPNVAGMQMSVRYVPGVAGIDVGGDWYDVAALDDGRLFIAVGDVSGRGLRAATTMAALRYASLAYAVEGASPAALLTQLSKLANLEDRGNFASMLCGVIDLQAGHVTLASAGHLLPLLMSNGDANFVSLKVGVPIGVPGGSPYSEATLPIRPGSTLIAFTDGLVERRGESLDVGLQRLRSAAVGHESGLDDLLGRLTAELAHEGAEDDTAILGIRWPS